MDVTLSNFDYCNRDDRKYCDGFNSSSSSSSSSSTSSASSFLPSILPVMQSPSPATWLSWLLFSLPLHLSTEYLESVSTQDLLDIVCGIENKSIDRVPYIDHRGLLDYPLLASTVVLSLFNSSNKQKILSSIVSEKIHSGVSGNSQKNFFSNFWPIIENSLPQRKNEKNNFEDSGNSDILHAIVSDFNSIFKSINGLKGTGNGTPSCENKSKFHLKVFDIEWLHAKIIARTNNSERTTNSVRTASGYHRYAPHDSINIEERIATNMTCEIQSDRMFRTYVDKRSVQNSTLRKMEVDSVFHFQLKYIGLLGWGILSCMCAYEQNLSEKNIKYPPNINGKNSQVPANQRNQNGQDADSATCDIGEMAANIQDIINEIMRKDDEYQHNYHSNLGSKNPINDDDQNRNRQGIFRQKALSINFCSSLVASCLTSTSNICGSKNRRLNSEKSKLSEKSVSGSNISGRLIVRNLAAGVGPIALSSLIKIVGGCVRKEWEIQDPKVQDPKKCDQESMVQDLVGQVTVTVVDDAPAPSSCPLGGTSKMEEDVTLDNNVELDLGSYLEYIKGL